MAQSTVLPPAYWWIGPDTLNFEEKKQKDEKFDEWYDGEEFKIWEENNTWTLYGRSGSGSIAVTVVAVTVVAVGQIFIPVYIVLV